MNYTGYISMVKTSLSQVGTILDSKLQTLVFLDFSKAVSDGNWDLKVHKNQSFMNDQLTPLWKLLANI